ncbi:MAG: hypothetical protein HPY71_13920 [Firmicutes bacterium]|nr:hypothetical protein [Bacillota bacterium]
MMTMIPVLPAWRIAYRFPSIVWPSADDLEMLRQFLSEREKAAYAFLARRKVIERIGLHRFPNTY